MRSSYLPSSVSSILRSFAPCFQAPSAEAFCAIAVGWVLGQGTHTVSRALIAARSMGLWRRHHAGLYRFLSQASWCADAVGAVLFRLFLPFLPPDIQVAVDDTLCHRSGPQIFGAGMHHDAARGTYGGAGGRRVCLAYGHSWVVLSVWVPFPWQPERGRSVPILLRLYRPKRRCPPCDYRKRTALAAEMLAVLISWLPEGRGVDLTGDREYGCQTLLRALGGRAHFTGALPMDAALYETTPARYRGLGRPPRKGRRLPTPKALAAHARAPWKRQTIRLYGRDVPILLQTRVATWWSVTGPMPVRVVVTRDPSGRLDDRAYFSTRADLRAEEMLRRYVLRWSLEVTFASAKQWLGLEEPRNGWWRRPHGERRPARRAGYEDRGEGGRRAAERTVPLILTVYGLVFAWYLVHGNPTADVARARRARPWDRQKVAVAYGDMLAAMRRVLWKQRLIATAAPRAVLAKLREFLPLLESAA